MDPKASALYGTAARAQAKAARQRSIDDPGHDSVKYGDLVDELRDDRLCTCWFDGNGKQSTQHYCLTCQAADEIERLRALVNDRKWRPGRWQG